MLINWRGPKKATLKSARRHFSTHLYMSACSFRGPLLFHVCSRANLNIISRRCCLKTKYVNITLAALGGSSTKSESMNFFDAAAATTLNIQRVRLSHLWVLSAAGSRRFRSLSSRHPPTRPLVQPRGAHCSVHRAVWKGAVFVCPMHPSCRLSLSADTQK